ncbi:MAG: hypothetical protein LBI45_02855 [Bacteroidales bacterium]|jgi:hypothetical protein|nr:hypothetical protein [Bacteroidales bacterium]
MTKLSKIEGFIASLERTHLSEKQQMTLMVNPEDVMGGSTQNGGTCNNTGSGCGGSINTKSCTNSGSNCDGSINEKKCTNTKAMMV